MGIGRPAGSCGGETRSMEVVMEQTGTIPRGLVEVSEWSELFERPGPVATVCIGTPAATENASHKNLLRWQAARRDLEGQGAPAGVTDVIEELIAPSRPSRPAKPCPSSKSSACTSAGAIGRSKA